jgi:hypothetical protein
MEYNIIMNKKYDNNNIIIASRAYFLHDLHTQKMLLKPAKLLHSPWHILGHKLVRGTRMGSSYKGIWSKWCRADLVFFT